MTIAVLDVGKTNAKLVVTDRPGAPLFSRTTPNVARQDGPYLHYDTDALWAFFQDALADAARAHRIETIVPAAHGGSGLLLGADALALPVMDYEFEGVAEIDAEYDALRDPFARTLSPRLPGAMNLGRQLFWQQRHLPDGFARARAILTYPQYWAWKLTGVAVAEVTSLGAHTDLWWPRERTPSALVARAGWSHLLPPIRPAWDVLGPPLPDLARRLGLAPDVRVLTGIHDSNASLLPYLATQTRPFSVISTGTWVIILGVGAPLEGLQEAADTLANVDATGTPVASFRCMGGREYATLAGEAPAAATEADLARVVARGTLAIPGFAASGGPFAGRPGRIAGPPPATPAERAALASLYVALMTDLGLEYLDAAQGPLIVEGSFVQNPAYAGLLQALRPGQPVLVSADTTGTAGGAARLAAWPDAGVPAALAPAAALAIPGLAGYRAAWRAGLPPLRD